MGILLRCYRSDTGSKLLAFQFGTAFPQWVAELQPKLNKYLVLNSISLEGCMQNIRTDSWGVRGVSDVLAQSCFDTDCKFVPSRFWTRSGDPFWSFDNSTFFQTRAGFQRGRCSYYVGKIHSRAKSWYYGEARPRFRYGC